MSTVLWANQLVDGEVVCEEEDYYALYRHTKRIDAICKSLKLKTLTSFCDFTDVRFNHGEIQLPPGATSSDDVMKVSGVWLDGAQAHHVLATVLDYVKTHKPRFGLFKNELADVQEELEAAVAFAQGAMQSGASFNFSVVE